MHTSKSGIFHAKPSENDFKLSADDAEIQLARDVHDIAHSKALIVDLTPAEPSLVIADSKVAMYAGYAFHLGVPVFGMSKRSEPNLSMLQYLLKHLQGTRSALSKSTEGGETLWRDRRKNGVENFGNPTNLMLAESLAHRALTTNASEAEALAKKSAETRPKKFPYTPKKDHVFLAGPDCFFPADKWKKQIAHRAEVCKQYGLEKVFCLDTNEHSAPPDLPRAARSKAYFAADVAMANDCPHMIANLVPFTHVIGHESKTKGPADDGTAFEVGGALAHGASVFGFGHNRRLNPIVVSALSDRMLHPTFEKAAEALNNDRHPISAGSA